MLDYSEEQRVELEALESIYPDSFTENLEDNDVIDILKLLALQAEENLGVVMIFTLVTAVQEKLDEIVDQIKMRREEEKKLKEREAEEAEKQLFPGTPVTVENFLCWKAKFDAELLEIKKKWIKEEEQAGKNKFSGKQLFETDHNLDTCDIQFLEDAGNNVEVEESLFQEPSMTWSWRMLRMTQTPTLLAQGVAQRTEAPSLESSTATASVAVLRGF
ncbi:RWD domain-containing protein 1 [Heterocephalus glaber]|uniref:RWD domain-containing protein 1 n=1 Tax=Heterocephalus glaber TaxID=10181 RepID=G5C280_HETGA|nr:RWD domain-containing protein 1 [Heterocephalus glaber]